MYDLYALTVQCDLYSSDHVLIAHEFSRATYPEIGVPVAITPFAPSERSRENWPAGKNQHHHTTLFASFLNKLNLRPMETVRWLDHVMIV